MESRAQSALEYLMTYGWALVVIVIVIAALVFLLGQSTSALNCSMSPASGAIGYIDHAVNSGTLTLKIRNDSGASISGVTYAYGGDFSASAVSSNPPVSFNSADSNTLTATATGVASGASYKGTVTITYTRSGVSHTAVASCTGRAA